MATPSETFVQESTSCCGPWKSVCLSSRPRLAAVAATSTPCSGARHAARPSVSDDGGGLDVGAILKRTVERKLIGASDELSDEAPYGRYSSSASRPSGRSPAPRAGASQAVRCVIKDLRGSVEVRSRPGVGTEVTLRLPLMLAIIDGLLVRVGQGDFVLPLASRGGMRRRKGPA